MQGTDAGLPATTATRSYGAWFKTTSTGATAMVLIAWAASAGVQVYMSSGALGILKVASVADEIQAPYVSDGQWHFLVVVEDNAAG